MTQSVYLPVRKRSPIRDILSAVFYFLCYEAISIVIQLGYMIYLYATLPLEGQTIETQEQMLNDAIYRDGNLLMLIIDVLVFLAFSVFFLARGKKFSVEMGMKKIRAESIPLAILAGIGLSCALVYVMNFIYMIAPQVMEDYNETMNYTYNTQEIFLYVLTGVIGAPLIEELVFRHLVTGRLGRAMPRILAIAIGGVLFGLVHSHPVQWVYAGVLGIIMACVYFAYDSIWVSIAMHAGFNAVSLISLIDVESMSEAQVQRLDSILSVGYLVFTLVGLAALVFLFVRKPHSIFYKNQSQTASFVGPSAEFVPAAQPRQTVQWDQLKTASYPVGTFPTVAELSKKMTKNPADVPSQSKETVQTVDSSEQAAENPALQDEENLPSQDVWEENR